MSQDQVRLQYLGPDDELLDVATETTWHRGETHAISAEDAERLQKHPAQWAVAETPAPTTPTLSSKEAK